MNRCVYVLESVGDNVTRWVVQGRHYCYAVTKLVTDIVSI